VSIPSTRELSSSHGIRRAWKELGRFIPCFVNSLGGSWGILSRLFIFPEKKQQTLLLVILGVLPQKISSSGLEGWSNLGMFFSITNKIYCIP